METSRSLVVIVTGASSGIGEAVSRRLFGSGFRVVLAPRRTASVAKNGVGTCIADGERRVRVFKNPDGDGRHHVKGSSRTSG